MFKRQAISSCRWKNLYSTERKQKQKELKISSPHSEPYPTTMSDTSTTFYLKYLSRKTHS